MPTPTNLSLYNESKDFIMSRYKKNSAYASGAIVKDYKQRFKKKYGEKSNPYIDDNNPKNLKRWFEERWIDINPLIGHKSDSAYPVFRPTRKVNEKSPTLYQDIPKSNLKEQFKLKQSYKGDKNLPTFKKITVHNGKGLSSSTFKNILQDSYRNENDNIDGFEKDKSISSKTSKVYHNPTTNQTVVAHQGTKGYIDWLNNAVYGLGGTTAYKFTPRYKEAEKVQKEASEKYGNENITTIGHSQSGLQAELLGGDTKEIITLNKATRPFSNTKNKNQYDISTSGDYISKFNPFQPKMNEKIIKSKTYNPYTEHQLSSLDNISEYLGE